MFFPELIKSIKSSDLVLEIGPGSNPHPRSDVFLERRFENEEVAFAQRGYAQKSIDKRICYYYDGGIFPFKDKEFDYIICSHVLEHIPQDELSLFISELQRVSSKGYLEFPNIFYELINYQSVHIWLMNYREGFIYFLNKKHFISSYLHKCYREMFYGNDNYLTTIFSKYKEFFFCGFEWQENINFQEVSSYDELINNEDHEKIKSYFANFKKNYPLFNLENLKKNVKYLRRIKEKIKSIMLKRSLIKNYFVHKTAQLNKLSLITIKANAEIKDYVIIQTHENPVVIGEFTQINPFTVIYGGSGVFIGNNVMIAPHCMIAAGNHDFKQLDQPMRFANSISKGPIIIEDNVWIGSNCTITDGVTIGQDSVVAANSVVNKNVAPYEIVGGVPAKVIGNRKDK